MKLVLSFIGQDVEDIYLLATADVCNITDMSNVPRLPWKPASNANYMMYLMLTASYRYLCMLDYRRYLGTAVTSINETT